jgi:hypothetical protein
MFDSFLFSRVGEGNALPSWATRPSSRVPSGRLNADCQNKRGAVETTESEIRVNPQQPGVVVVRFQIALHWAAFERQNDQQTEHAPSDAKRSVPNVVVAGHGGGGGPPPPRHQDLCGSANAVTVTGVISASARTCCPRADCREEEDYAVRATPVVVHSAHALLTFWSCTLASVSASLFTFALVEK